MKNTLVILFSVLFLSSCKTSFEKARTSNDPPRIYKAALAYYDAEEYRNAQSLFELVIPYYRGKAEAEELFYKYAYAHYYLGEYILANHYFTSFAKTFFNSEKREEADYMAAYSNMEMSPNHRLDQSYSQKAIEEFQQFTNKYPQSERVALCNQHIDEMRDKLELKAYEQGKLYYDLKNFNSAIASFDNMLKDFPESDKALEVRYLIVKSSYEWAVNSIYEKKEERFNETIKRYKQFIYKYPSSGYNKELEDINKDAKESLKNLKDV